MRPKSLGLRVATCEPTRKCQASHQGLGAVSFSFNRSVLLLISTESSPVLPVPHLQDFDLGVSLRRVRFDHVEDVWIDVDEPTTSLGGSFHDESASSNYSFSDVWQTWIGRRFGVSHQRCPTTGLRSRAANDYTGR